MSELSRPLYKLVLDDAGRNLSRRPRSYSDCSVRALTIAADLTFDLTYDELAAAGRKPCDGFDLVTYMRYRRTFLGRPFKRVSFRKPLTTSEILARYPDQRVIIEYDDHVCTAVDGVVYDLIRQAEDEPVLGVWLFG